MGSSSISRIIIGNTGPTGPKGNTGAIGPTGVGSGLTGITGPSGAWINSFSVLLNGDIKFLSSTNTEYLISGTKGNTGFTGTIFGENIGSGLTVFSSQSGYTLIVRGISFIGGLSAGISGGGIVVFPADLSYGLSISNQIKNDKIVYSESENIINSTRISFGKTYGEFSFSNFNGITTGSFAVYSEVNSPITTINGSDFPDGITLNVINNGFYKIETPLRWNAITLDGGTYNSNELISATLFINGNSIVKLPTNLFFGGYTYSSIFGCGMNIMNIMTLDAGQNWFATITDRGYGVDQCEELEGLGSCCGRTGCTDYLTQAECVQLGGTWNAFKACSDAVCPFDAICCSNGACISGIAEEECLKFGGSYYRGITCLADETGNNQVRTCYDRNQDPTVCCHQGQCIENVTFRICNEFFGGTPVAGDCQSANCSGENRIGACCPKPDGLQTCIENLTAEECKDENGIYRGDDTDCLDCQTLDPTGACCYDDGTECTILTQAQCSAGNGSWQGAASNCSVCSPTEATGACCFGGACDIRTESDCNFNGGSYQGDGSSCSSNPCQPPTPTGACCKDSMCTPNVTEAECRDNIGGIYQGDGSECTPTICNPPPTTGACCNIGILTDPPEGQNIQFCEQLTPEECAFRNSQTGTHVFKGLGTSCSYNTCEFGSCCNYLLGSAACLGSYYTEEECNSIQGDFIIDRPCNTNPCRIGACCLQNTIALCTQQTIQSCTNIEGLFQGSGIQCDSNPCGFGACCPVAGGLPVCAENQNQAGCDVLQGIFAGANTTCDDCFAPPAIGACCVGTTCVPNKTPAQCITLNGVYRGDGIPCSTNLCSSGIIRGACCIEDVNIPAGYTCVDERTPTQCAASGGFFYGDDSQCINVECPCGDPEPPDDFAPCCYYKSSINDLTCEIKSREECFLIGGNYVTGATECLEGICQPPESTCDFTNQVHYPKYYNAQGTEFVWSCQKWDRTVDLPSHFFIFGFPGTLHPLTPSSRFYYVASSNYTDWGLGNGQDTAQVVPCPFPYILGEFSTYVVNDWFYAFLNRSPQAYPIMDNNFGINPLFAAATTIIRPPGDDPNVCFGACVPPDEPLPGCPVDEDMAPQQNPEVCLTITEVAALATGGSPQIIELFNSYCVGTSETPCITSCYGDPHGFFEPISKLSLLHCKNVQQQLIPIATEGIDELGEFGNCSYPYPNFVFKRNIEDPKNSFIRLLDMKMLMEFNCDDDPPDGGSAWTFRFKFPIYVALPTGPDKDYRGKVVRFVEEINKGDLDNSDPVIREAANVVFGKTKAASLVIKKPEDGEDFLLWGAIGMPKEGIHTHAVEMIVTVGEITNCNICLASPEKANSKFLQFYPITNKDNHNEFEPSFRDYMKNGIESGGQRYGLMDLMQVTDYVDNPQSSPCFVFDGTDDLDHGHFYVDTKVEGQVVTGGPYGPPAGRTDLNFFKFYQAYHQPKSSAGTNGCNTALTNNFYIKPIAINDTTYQIGCAGTPNPCEEL